MRNLTGGCLCGSVRYRLASEPFDCGWCHCRTCQLNSGAPAMAFASIKHGDWMVTGGAEHIRRARSSSFAERLFCGRCGTPLGIDYDIQPETFDFSVATLDDRARLNPDFTSLGKQGRLVQSRRRLAKARPLSARHCRARGNRAA